MTEKVIEWDLSEFYDGIDDPQMKGRDMGIEVLIRRKFVKEKEDMLATIIVKLR